MKAIASIIILGFTYCTAVFADELPTIDTAVPIEQQTPDFGKPTLTSPNFANRYYSLSISGLTQRLVNFEIGRWKRNGNNSYAIALKQIYRKGIAGFLGSWQYRRHLDPFDSFEFYSGLGADAGFIFDKEVPAVAVIVPTFSIGKIISQTKDVTQFLELRSNLPGLYAFVNYSTYGLTKPRLNYSFFYGISF